VSDKPSVTVSHTQDPTTDEHGQRWSPAEITVAWPPTPGMPAPWLKIGVVAAVREDMTLDEFREAVITAALDVMSAALLQLEDRPAGKRRRLTGAGEVA
jgi:hypothetical protein